MRYLLYARVSPKGSSWAGTETTTGDQLAAGKAYIRARDPEAEISTAVDELKSGATVSARPEFSRIVADLHDGRAEWDVFAVWRLDRAFRSTADAAPFFRELLRQGKGFQSVTENLDLASPAGRAMLGMLMVFAEFERESTSQRTLLKMESIAASGRWPVGYPPYGYARGPAHDNILKVDPARAGIVRELFRLYASGDAGAAELAKRLGIPGKTTALRILRNRAYLGRIVYNGREYPGLHEPLVTEELFAAVQSRLPNSTTSPRPAAQKYPYLLAGVIRCHCGHALSPYSSSSRGKRFSYYQCTDARCGTRVRAQSLDNNVLTLLNELEFEDEDIRALLDEFDRQQAEEERQRQPEREHVAAAVRAKAAEKERIMQAIIDGLVTRANAEEWNERLSQCRDELMTLQARQQALAVRQDPADTSRATRAWVENLGAMRQAIRAAGENADSLRHIVLSHVQSVRFSPPQSGEKTPRDFTVSLVGGETFPVRLLEKVASPTGVEPVSPG